MINYQQYLDNDGITKEYVSDYLIERKKADDLASSILDGRYKQQKYRIIKCGLQNAIFIIEGLASKSAVLPQSTIDNAICSTRTKDKFKCKQTSTCADTVRYVLQMHNWISKQFRLKVQQQSDINQVQDLQIQLQFQYTYDDFMQYTSKIGELKAGNIFSKMLNQIRGLGQDAKFTIYKEYQTFIAFYNQIQQFKDIEDVYLFINGLTGTKTQAKKNKLEEFQQKYKIQPLYLNRNIAKLLAIVFYENVYPNNTNIENQL